MQKTKRIRIKSRDNSVSDIRICIHNSYYLITRCKWPFSLLSYLLFLLQRMQTPLEQAIVYVFMENGQFYLECISHLQSSNVSWKKSV